MLLHFVLRDIFYNRKRYCLATLISRKWIIVHLVF